MIAWSAARRGAAAPALLLAALLLQPDAAAGSPARPAAADSLRRVEEQGSLPGRLFARLERERALGHDRAVLELAYEIVDRHPGFPQADRALFDAVLAARRLRDLGLARQLAAELPRRFPRSPTLAELGSLSVISIENESDTTIDRTSGVDNARDDSLARAPAAALIDTLGRLPAAGQTRLVPAEADLGAASHAPASPVPRQESSPPAFEPTRLGLLCPLTGAGARGGAAVRAGAQLAIEQAARQGWRQVRLEALDTEGDAGRAALAVRRLVVERRALALLGDLSGAATLSAGVAADAWGVPLVVLADDAGCLRGLSPSVVPTDLREGHDARLLARLAVSALDRRRGAVLYPDTPDGERACDAFGAALLAAGGRLVATAAGGPDGADAEAGLRQLAAVRPEVLYLPFPASALPRLAAQLAAAPTGARLLGPSLWAGAPAAALADPALGGAVFPADQAVWPAAWREAFTREWPAAAPDGADAAADRDGWRGYAAARLFLSALADCAAAPERDRLATALNARWSRLRDAAVPEVDAVRGACVVEEGAVVPFPPRPRQAEAAR